MVETFENTLNKYNHIIYTYSSLNSDILNREITHKLISEQCLDGFVSKKELENFILHYYSN